MREGSFSVGAMATSFELVEVMQMLLEILQGQLREEGEGEHEREST